LTGIWSDNITEMSMEFGGILGRRNCPVGQKALLIKCV
jgi:hypothetical protein